MIFQNAQALEDFGTNPIHELYVVQDKIGRKSVLTSLKEC